MASSIARSSSLSLYQKDVEAAETQLLLGCFDSAFSRSVQTLGKFVYVPNSTPLQTRAFYVLLQSLYELNRLDEADKYVLDYYGSIQHASVEVVLLWAALKCADGLASTCKQPLQQLLNPEVGSKGSFTELDQDQYESVAKLYSLEVLPSVDGAAKALEWVQSSSCKLETSVKKAVCSSLRSRSGISASSSAASSPSKPTQTPQATASTPLPDPAPAMPSPPAAHAAEIQPCTPQDERSTGQRTAVRTSSRTGSAKSTTILQARSWSDGISPAAVMAVSSAVAVLAYATFAERKAIRRALRRVYQWGEHHVMDIVGASVALSANPVGRSAAAAARPTQLMHRG